MTGHGNKVTRKTEQAIAALLLHPTIGAAAKASGISEKTMWRWLKDPNFVDRYHAARAEAVDRATGRLQYASEFAVNTLISVMADRATSAAVKVAAARTVLEMAFQAVTVEDLQRRVAALVQDHEPTRARALIGEQNGDARIH